MPLVRETPDPVGVFNLSFKVPATEDNKKLLKDLQIMAAKDGESFSDIIRSALQEYHERHSPGNPQLILGHWSENLPLPKTVTEHHWKQMRSVDSEAGPAWVCVDQNCREGWFQP